MKKYIWMLVTKDDLSLPLAVADSAGQLARLIGTTQANVVSRENKGRTRGYKHPSIIKVVELLEDVDNDSRSYESNP